MNRRIHLVAGCVALACASAAPAAQATTPSLKIYEIAGASGVFDLESQYFYPPSCPGGDGYHIEEHADFKLRGTGGGTLINNTGSLIIPLSGGYDGVHRTLDCNGNVVGSCERHFSYVKRNMVTLTFVKRGRGARVTGALTGLPVTDCPLVHANAIYLGKARVSRSKLRSKKFTVNLQDRETLKDGSPEVTTGSSEGSFRVTIRRKH